MFLICPHLFSADLTQRTTFHKSICKFCQKETDGKCVIRGNYNNKNTTDLHVLSNRFRRYFFCSTSGFTNSITCSTELTRSPVYADWPLTWFTLVHNVRDMTPNALSHADSISRSCVLIARDITLRGRHYERLTNARHNQKPKQTWRIIRTLPAK
jgi:hypothetical protein